MMAEKIDAELYLIEERPNYQSEDLCIQLRQELNNVKRQELENESRFNEKITKLMSQMTHTQAILERSETQRHELELDLLQQRQQMFKMKQENDANILSKDQINSDLQIEIKKLRGEVLEITHQGQNHQHLCDSQFHELQTTLANKNQLIQELEAELELINAEQISRDAKLLDNDEKSTNLQKTVSELKGFLHKSEEKAQKYMIELDYYKSREIQNKQEFEQASERITQLERALEDERESHLQSKLNGELVQIQLKQLQGSVNKERLAQSESQKVIDQVTLKLQNLEEIRESDKKKSITTKEKMNSLEKERDHLKDKLSVEINNKKSEIISLSSEIKEQQSNFLKLKDELLKTKRKLKQSEDSYSKNISEIWSVVNGDVFSDPQKASDSPLNVPRKLSSQLINVSNLKSEISRIFSGYQRSIKKKNAEVQMLLSKNSAIAKDYKISTQQNLEKEQELKEIQERQTKITVELMNLKDDYMEQETKLNNMSGELGSVKELFYREKEKIISLTNTIQQQIVSHDQENSDKFQMLLNLHKEITNLGPTRSNHRPDSTFPNLYSQILSQIADIKDDLKNKENVNINIMSDYSDKLTGLKSQQLINEQKYLNQKIELENKYEKMLSDLNLQTQKEKHRTKVAWDQVLYSGSIKQKIDSEYSQLYAEHQKVVRDNASLLTAIALLAGAVFPLLSRLHQLTFQHSLYREAIERQNTVRTHLIAFLNTLDKEFGADRSATLENSADSSAVIVNRRYILKFRVAIIAVMAASRLRHFVSISTKLFSLRKVLATDSYLQFCVGTEYSRTSLPFTGLNEIRPSKVKEDKTLYSWLSNNELQATVLTSVHELQEILTSDSNLDYNSLGLVTKSCFIRLLDRLAPFFQNQLESSLSQSRFRSGLVPSLGHRLKSILKNLPHSQKQIYLNNKEIFSSTRALILEILRRLEISETEKQQTFCQNHLSSKRMVDLSRYDEACTELSNALYREQTLQTLLKQQSNQISELRQAKDVSSVSSTLYTTDSDNQILVDKSSSEESDCGDFMPMSIDMDVGLANNLLEDQSLITCRQSKTDLELMTPRLQSSSQ